MQPLTVDDVRPPSTYEPLRSDARREIIELKRDRRVALGDLLTLVFENRETVRGVIEELLRAERIEDRERIAEELATFNTLVPGDSELCATLFLEITDPAELSARLSTLMDIEAAIRLEVDGVAAESIPEQGRSREDRTSSVHYLRFRLDSAQREAFLRDAEVAVVAEHPGYRARALLTERQRKALAADLLRP
jgi:hypothetical protein